MHIQCNIIFLQDTHCTPDIQRIWRSEWGGDIIFANGASNSRGVAILFDRNLKYECLQKVIDVQGRYIVAHVIIDGIEYLLCNIYAPTQGNEMDQLLTLTQILEELKEIETENFIVGGDFNEVLDPATDRKM